MVLSYPRRIRHGRLSPVFGALASTLIVVGGLTLATLLVPRARALVTLSAVGALAAAGLYTAALQYIAGYLSVFEWPTFFRVSHNLAWVAAALLAADVVVGLVRERASPQRPAGGSGPHP